LAAGRSFRLARPALAGAVMIFAPKPENDFAQFIRAYYDECRSRFAEIEAIAGKWTFRDLIPGMSDFDTRFILRDTMDADDWCRMSTAIGEAHLALCRRYPCWARNLEHLPGINLTWTELLSERLYYPEYQQWSFYHTEQPDRLASALRRFAQRAWDAKDEYFHLKKFCLFYGRYDRAIDPPVNLGQHRSKYPLHSRLMHYFTPPVHSAVCLLLKRNIVGKFEALETAAGLFPDLACWATLNEILGADYRAPVWYVEPALSRLEDQLEQALQAIARALRPALTLVPADAGVDITAWKAALRGVPVDPALLIFENAKFSRLMKGRLRFYAAAPEFFETDWLIENELRRIGNNFFRAPFRTYWKIRSGQSIDNPAAILDQLEDDPLTAGQIAAVKEFDRLTSVPPPPERRRETALAIAAIFDDFYRALSAISQAV
jgi:broad specificity phosphatase PhoE